jgi:hypothetical protein
METRSVRAFSAELSGQFQSNIRSLERQHFETSLFPKSGVDVVITVFCNFKQLSAKKIGVFLKKQCHDPSFA